MKTESVHRFLFAAFALSVALPLTAKQHSINVSVYASLQNYLSATSGQLRRGDTLVLNFGDSGGSFTFDIRKTAQFHSLTVTGRKATLLSSADSGGLELSGGFDRRETPDVTLDVSTLEDLYRGRLSFFDPTPRVRVRDGQSLSVTVPAGAVEETDAVLYLDDSGQFSKTGPGYLRMLGSADEFLWIGGRGKINVEDGTLSMNGDNGRFGGTITVQPGATLTNADSTHRFLAVYGTRPIVSHGTLEARGKVILPPISGSGLLRVPAHARPALTDNTAYVLNRVIVNGRLHRESPQSTATLTVLDLMGGNGTLHVPVTLQAGVTVDATTGVQTFKKSLTLPDEKGSVKIRISDRQWNAYRKDPNGGIPILKSTETNLSALLDRFVAVDENGTPRKDAVFAFRNGLLSVTESEAPLLPITELTADVTQDTLWSETLAQIMLRPEYANRPLDPRLHLTLNFPPKRPGSAARTMTDTFRFDTDLTLGQLTVTGERGILRQSEGTTLTVGDTDRMDCTELTLGVRAFKSVYGNFREVTVAAGNTLGIVCDVGTEATLDRAITLSSQLPKTATEPEVPPARFVKRGPGTLSLSAKLAGGGRIVAEKGQLRLSGSAVRTAFDTVEVGPEAELGTLPGGTLLPVANELSGSGRIDMPLTLSDRALLIAEHPKALLTVGGQLMLPGRFRVRTAAAPTEGTPIPILRTEKSVGLPYGSDRRTVELSVGETVQNGIFCLSKPKDTDGSGFGHIEAVLRHPPQPMDNPDGAYAPEAVTALIEANQGFLPMTVTAETQISEGVAYGTPDATAVGHAVLLFENISESSDRYDDAGYLTEPAADLKIRYNFGIAGLTPYVGPDGKTLLTRITVQVDCPRQTPTLPGEPRTLPPPKADFAKDTAFRIYIRPTNAPKETEAVELTPADGGCFPVERDPNQPGYAVIREVPFNALRGHSVTVRAVRHTPPSKTLRPKNRKRISPEK